MRPNIKRIIVVLVILAVLFLAGRYGFTVVSTEQAAQAIQSETFDPDTYVDGMWGTVLQPAYEKDTVALTKILSKLTPDSNGAIDKESLTKVTNEFGNITVGEANVYMVSGTGEVVAVNTESTTGTIEVKVDGYDGPVKVLIYIGPRIPSDETSIRDAGEYIAFGDFKEQTEYGKVSSSINKRVIAEVIGADDKASWEGKQITFSGAFSIRTFNLIQIDMSKISIVPMSIELGE